MTNSPQLGQLGTEHESWTFVDTRRLTFVLVKTTLCGTSLTQANSWTWMRLPLHPGAAHGRLVFTGSPYGPNQLSTLFINHLSDVGRPWTRTVSFSTSTKAVLAITATPYLCSGSGTACSYPLHHRNCKSRKDRSSWISSFRLIARPNFVLNIPCWLGSAQTVIYRAGVVGMRTSSLDRSPSTYRT